MWRVFTLRILATSLLLILSFPRPDLGWVSFVALVPLLTGLSGLTRRRAFFSGWGGGTLWFFVSYNWVSHSVSVFGGIPFSLAEGVIILLAGIHGLYVAVFAMLVAVVTGEGGGGTGAGVHGSKGVRAVQGPESRVQGKSVGESSERLAPSPPFTLTPLLVLPSAWVLLEVARTWFPAPFPWLLLGSAMWKIPISGTLFEVSGVYGVSFWIVSINVLLWMAMGAKGRDLARLGIILVLLLLLPLALVVVQKESSGPTVTVGVVQGNFQQKLKWDENLREETLNTYLSLSDEAVRKGARIVIWPETAMPTFYQAQTSLAARIRQFTVNRNIHLIFGSPGYEVAGSEILLYNRVYHVSSDGEEAYYDKNVLVPFGEYVPLARLLPFVDRMVPGEGEFARGVWKGPFKTPVPSATLICFEVSFPSLARRRVHDGSLMLMNVTNDAWFGRSWGPYQHLAVAAVRAMENRTPVFRAANTGISAIIDSSGRIVEAIPLEERGVIVAEVATGMGQTLYTRLGDWIVIPSAAVVSVYLLVLLTTWRSRKWTE